MAWPVALFCESGATIYTLPNSYNVLASSKIPSAYIPSSLVISLFILFSPYLERLNIKKY